MILVIKTDSPLVYLAVLSKDGKELASEHWQADRRLAQGILEHIESLLHKSGGGFGDIMAVFVYKGPGSFTGLRIGIMIANTIAYSADVTVLGETGNSWQKDCFRRLKSGENDVSVVPLYGANAHINPPKK